MNNFWTVLIHTFITRLKSKAFLITTGILLAVILALTNITTIIETFSSDSKTEMIVIDEASNYYEPLEEKLLVTDTYELTTYEKGFNQAKEAVLAGEADGLIVLQKDKEGYPKAKFFAKQISESFDYEIIEDTLQEIKMEAVIAEIGLSGEEVMKINEPIEFETGSLADGAKTDEEANQARMVTYILTIALYMMILFYGNIIATDVAAEKSSRVMELVVSSVSPVSHMFGKIVGILMLSMTQFIVLGGVGLLSLRLQKDQMIDSVMSEVLGESISPSVIVYALIFFVLGYLLYATMAAMLGSLVSRVEDVSMLLMPMTFLILIAFFIAMFGLASPSAKFVTVSSYIPFFAPILMFLRVTMLKISIVSVIISILILIITIVLLAMLGSRVYRGGVLMYGGSVKFKDFIYVFRLTKKE